MIGNYSQSYEQINPATYSVWERFVKQAPVLTHRFTCPGPKRIFFNIAVYFKLTQGGFTDLTYI